MIKNRFTEYTKETIIRLLTSLKHELNINGEGEYFRDIKENSNSITFTCPFHNNHNERRPSCGIVLKKGKDPFYHCFTCGESGTLPKLVSKLLHITIDEGEEWLYQNFGGEHYEETHLEPIILDNNGKNKTQYLDSEILNQYNYYHPYMWKRRLTKEVVDKYCIGYDPARDMITFPVWDDKNNLIMVTARSTKTKNFYIQKEKEKPVYLLNFALNEKVKTLYICESQLNTLTLLGYNNVKAVGLIGTGAYNQYEILNKCGVNHFIIALDPDIAGFKGTYKLIKYLNKDKIIDVLEIPEGKKDLNDYTEEEFRSFPIISSYDWLEKNKKRIEEIIFKNNDDN